MATVVCVYSERTKRFHKIAAKVPLEIEELRRLMGGPLRYCIGGSYLYFPAEDERFDDVGHLCWARVPITSVDDLGVDDVYDADLSQLRKCSPEKSELEILENMEIRIGDRYIKRLKEVNGAFVQVESFCAQELIDSLAKNPEALPSVSHSEFEGLCAEIFVRRGFKVDLFRASGDGGIDFLALQDEGSDPIVFAVQCKQPEVREGKKRKSAGRPALQQVYGAAKAWDLKGGILISGSTYSPYAKKFAALKNDEMKVYGGKDLLEWITKFRWNEGE